MTDSALHSGASQRSQDDRRLLAADDSDERVCAPIPDAACMEDPGSFSLNLVSGAFAKLGEQLASPGLVLPWMLAGIGTSATVIGLLVPVKLAGSLVPQLTASARVRRQLRRKWVWVGAALWQALMLTIIGASALILPPEMAGPLTVAAFAAFSVAAGAGALAYQDVVGKTIPPERRARLVTGRVLLGVLFVLGAAVAFRELIGDLVSSQITLPMVAVPLVGAAALAWALAALFFAAIGERSGATSGGRFLLGELGAGLGLLRHVPGYWRFVLARGLLVAVELAAPFYALHASKLYGNGAGPLSIYIGVLALAPLVAAVLWARWARAATRTAMSASGVLAALAGGLALELGRAPRPEGAWAYAAVFLLIGVAESGLRQARKAYLLVGVPDAERPLYAGFSNTVAALLALVGGGLGVLVDYTAPDKAIAIVAGLAVLGALAALTLPRADRLSGPARDAAPAR